MATMGLWNLSTLPAVATPALPLAALDVHVTLPGAALFTIGMVGTGFLLGHFLGDEYQLLSFLKPRSKSESPEAMVLVDAALTAIERNERIPDHDKLVAVIDGPEAVDRLFSGERLEPLLAVLERPLGDGDPSTGGKRDDVYSLLAHIATKAAEPLRIGIASAMARALLRHRHLTPHLVEVARQDPNIWNDVGNMVERAATVDGGVQRFVEGHANDQTEFVRRANDFYLNEMVRFRRLCEDSALAGIGAVVHGELASIVDREFTVLEVSGTTSKRFVWMVSQGRAVAPLLNDERMEILIDSAQRGSADACALSAQAALVHLDNGKLAAIEEIIDALGYGAMRHLSAADALLGMFSAILPAKRGGKLNANQDIIRRRVFDLLQRAGASSFDVRAMLGTHGVRGDVYPEYQADLPSDTTYP